MRVARLYGPGDLRLAHETRPVAGPGTSLVRVTAVGICGSDLHWYAEAAIGDARLDAPLVVGHEFAGVVVGGELDGRRVAVDPAQPCRACGACLRGDRNLCPYMVFAGHGGCDGALREYLVWPTDLLHPLPDTVSDAEGAMLEPLGVAIHALDLAHLRLGASVGVFGAGPIGLLLVQLARAAGAGTVLAVGPLPHRREAAARAGAQVVLAPGDAGYPEDLDLAYEVSGTDEALPAAMRAVRPGARVVLVGIPDKDRTSFPASTARRKGLSLVMVRRMRETYPRAIRAVTGGVDVASLVTRRFPLEAAAEAFAWARDRTGLKTLVEVG